jgi:dTDP-4-amino-4,6-dideoxygalactose transaminase
MSWLIPFNKPPYTGNEDKYVLDSMRSEKISGDGAYSRRCEAWFTERLACKKALLTPSCTQALELAAILIDIQPGDEVIMPSYTFVSTANAFVLRGAKIVFVDIRPDTMNLNERLIEAAVTSRTKAIVPVHYAGVGCEMNVLMEIANRHNLYVIEDAAQGMMSKYHGKDLGTFGHMATYSFHETKNFTSGGEGGLLIINDDRFSRRAEIVREKGTNRSEFFRGEIDKYTWVDIGSSYLPSDIQAAYLWGQLECATQIISSRRLAWERYHRGLVKLAEKSHLVLPEIPQSCEHNSHMFYIKTTCLEQRTALLAHLQGKGMLAVFHYVPLHTAPAGKEFGALIGDDVFTTVESERLIRLPLYYGISPEEIDSILGAVYEFYS